MALKQFKTESKRLMDMMINSIYTHKEIFLRELISNASDAIDKLYFLSLTDDRVTTGKDDYYIRIRIDKEARAITIWDNGVGMTEEELEKNLGTIARSGSRDFKAENADDDIAIIGQFGVGFYSAFMVASRVVVKSRAFGSDQAYQWESTGVTGYKMSACEKEDVGTEITLYLKENAGQDKYDEYLDSFRIAELVKKYSDYVRYPIQLESTETTSADGDEAAPAAIRYETLNTMVPIWRRDKKDVSDDEYASFYAEKYHGYGRPARIIHSKTEGAATYNALLFIPSEAPYDYFSKDFQKGLQLYSNGVLIMDKCGDLLPDYFSFVQGLVDSQDLSLNISREMLQHDGQLQLIRATLEKKIKNELLQMMKTDREKYELFFQNFGLPLKMGCYADFGFHKLLLQDLLLFYSAKQGKMVTLDEYGETMPEGQPYVYYAAGSSNEQLSQLPTAERVLEKGYDILYLTDDIDEFVLQMISTYKTWEFRNISNKDLGLESEDEKKELQEKEEACAPIFQQMATALEGKVSAVRLTQRLKKHPACISSDGPLSLEMEKVLNSIPGQERIESEKVLEINADHPVFAALQGVWERGDQARVNQYANLLYNQALLMEGMSIDDPVGFANDICALMADVEQFAGKK